MKKILCLALCAAPFWAFAAPPQEDPNGGGRYREELSRRRVLMAMGIAEALDLDTAQALKVDQVLRSFDERRRAVRDRVRQASRVLERTAQGEATSAGAVDAAIQELFEARAQMGKLDREMFDALSKGLSAEKRARLAMFLVRLQRGGPFRHGPGRE
jgi:hypothetical protein